MDLALRPKSDYLKSASVDSLYVLTEHWKSDMQFYEDEIKFMKHLIQKHFSWLILSGKLDEIKELTNQLTTIEIEAKNLNKRVDKHLIHLEELLNNSFTHDEQEFRGEHMNLETDMLKFFRKFRTFKKELFDMAKTGLDKEKMHYLKNGKA